jgi:hypothetical protein
MTGKSGIPCSKIYGNMLSGKSPSNSGVRNILWDSALTIKTRYNPSGIGCSEVPFIRRKSPDATDNHLDSLVGGFILIFTLMVGDSIPDT